MINLIFEKFCECLRSPERCMRARTDYYAKVSWILYLLCENKLELTFEEFLPVYSLVRRVGVCSVRKQTNSQKSARYHMYYMKIR